MKPARKPIAVVMAAYNAEKTISAAIESVLSQDFGYFSFRILDDCSTDRTSQIIKYYAELDNRIVHIRQPERLGYAAALHRGLQGMPAEFIITCDADDTMRPGALRRLLTEARKTDAKVVIAPYVRICGDKQQLVKPRSDIGGLNDMPIDTVHFSLCNKLIASTLIDPLASPVPGFDRWADLSVVARVIAQNPEVAVIDTPVYNYFDHAGASSLTKSNKNRTLHDRIAITDHLIEWFREQELESVNSEFLNHLKFCAKVKYARNPERDMKKWGAIYPEINRRIMSLRHIPFHFRLLFRAAALLYG